jgi:hypothetical protein
MASQADVPLPQSTGLDVQMAVGAMRRALGLARAGATAARRRAGTAAGGLAADLGRAGVARPVVDVFVLFENGTEPETLRMALGYTAGNDWKAKAGILRAVLKQAYPLLVEGDVSAAAEILLLASEPESKDRDVCEVPGIARALAEPPLGLSGDDLRFDLQRNTVVIGPNGGGKSSLLEALIESAPVAEHCAVFPANFDASLRYSDPVGGGRSRGLGRGRGGRGGRRGRKSRGQRASTGPGGQTSLHGLLEWYAQRASSSPGPDGECRVLHACGVILGKNVSVVPINNGSNFKLTVWPAGGEALSYFSGGAEWSSAPRAAFGERAVLSTGECVAVALVLFFHFHFAAADTGCAGTGCAMLDECDAFMNAAIWSRLLAYLVDEFPDVIQVAITHNFEFAQYLSSRKSPKAHVPLLLTSGQPRSVDTAGGVFNWEWNLCRCDLLDMEQMQTILTIMCARGVDANAPCFKETLLVEGSDSGLDVAVYSSLFPEFDVRGLKSCTKVVAVMESIFRLCLHNNSGTPVALPVRTCAIVDGDTMPDKRIEYLNGIGVAVLPYRGVELLLLHPDVLEVRAREIADEEAGSAMVAPDNEDVRRHQVKLLNCVIDSILDSIGHLAAGGLMTHEESYKDHVYWDAILWRLRTLLASKQDVEAVKGFDNPGDTARISLRMAKEAANANGSFQRAQSKVHVVSEELMRTIQDTSYAIDARDSAVQAARSVRQRGIERIVDLEKTLEALLRVVKGHHIEKIRVYNGLNSTVSFREHANWAIKNLGNNGPLRANLVHVMEPCMESAKGAVSRVMAPDVQDLRPRLAFRFKKPVAVDGQRVFQGKRRIQLEEHNVATWILGAYSRDKLRALLHSGPGDGGLPGGETGYAQLRASAMTAVCELSAADNARARPIVLAFSAVMMWLSQLREADRGIATAALAKDALALLDGLHARHGLVLKCDELHMVSRDVWSVAARRCMLTAVGLTDLGAGSGGELAAGIAVICDRLANLPPGSLPLRDAEVRLVSTGLRSIAIMRKGRLGVGGGNNDGVTVTAIRLISSVSRLVSAGTDPRILRDLGQVLALDKPSVTSGPGSESVFFGAIETSAVSAADDLTELWSCVDGSERNASDFWRGVMDGLEDRVTHLVLAMNSNGGTGPPGAVEGAGDSDSLRRLYWPDYVASFVRHVAIHLCGSSRECRSDPGVTADTDVPARIIGAPRPALWHVTRSCALDPVAVLQPTPYLIGYLLEAVAMHVTTLVDNTVIRSIANFVAGISHVSVEYFPPTPTRRNEDCGRLEACTLEIVRGLWARHESKIHPTDGPTRVACLAAIATIVEKWPARVMYVRKRGARHKGYPRWDILPTSHATSQFEIAPMGSSIGHFVAVEYKKLKDMLADQFVEELRRSREVASERVAHAGWVSNVLVPALNSACSSNGMSFESGNSTDGGVYFSTDLPPAVPALAVVAIDEVVLIVPPLDLKFNQSAGASVTFHVKMRATTEVKRSTVCVAGQVVRAVWHSSDGTWRHQAQTKGVAGARGGGQRGARNQGQGSQDGLQGAQNITELVRSAILVSTARISSGHEVEKIVIGGGSPVVVSSTARDHATYRFEGGFAVYEARDVCDVAAPRPPPSSEKRQRKNKLPGRDGKLPARPEEQPARVVFVLGESPTPSHNPCLADGNGPVVIFELPRHDVHAKDCWDIHRGGELPWLEGKGIVNVLLKAGGAAAVSDTPLGGASNWKNGSADTTHMVVMKRRQLQISVLGHRVTVMADTFARNSDGDRSRRAQDQGRGGRVSLQGWE